MEEHIQQKGEPKKAKKKVTISVAVGLKSLIIVIVSVALLALAFYLGWHFGYRSQTNKSSTLPFNTTSQAFTKHRAIVGTISKVSSSQITVQMSNKQTQSASINSSTIIRNTKGQSTSATSLKTGSRVIVTATVGSNNSMTAENILVLD